MRYFLDTEFNGFGGKLLSIALVREDGASFYAITSRPLDRDIDPWVLANVLPSDILCSCDYSRDIQGYYTDRQERGFKYYMCLGEDLAKFLKGDPSPHIISDWPDDIRHFCEQIITGPGEMVPIPHLTFEVVHVDAYPTTLPGAIQHNAWWDAMALRHLLCPGQYGTTPSNPHEAKP